MRFMKIAHQPRHSNAAFKAQPLRYLLCMPLPAHNVVMRALEVAEQRLGPDELQRRLKASARTISAWRSRRVSMPVRKYIALVDLLSLIEPDWVLQGSARIGETSGSQ